jgi:hypothetical protein
VLSVISTFNLTHLRKQIIIKSLQEDAQVISKLFTRSALVTKSGSNSASRSMRYIRTFAEITVISTPSSYACRPRTPGRGTEAYHPLSNRLIQP